MITYFYPQKPGDRREKTNHLKTTTVAGRKVTFSLSSCR